MTAVAIKGMRAIPGGEFAMGSTSFYPEEGPVRTVAVEPFLIDEHPVTVAEFRRFVKATGHVTWAEQAPEAAAYPDADPELLVPGSLVFTQPPGPVPLDDFTNWWRYQPGADWRHPEGPGSNVGGREYHPVTHVGFEDALAYAEWSGKDLPTEAQWEFAARGGIDSAPFAWGDDPDPRKRANTWEGEFPWRSTREGAPGTSPVGVYPPNGYGLVDIIGNVWEWTRDVFDPAAEAGACCHDTAPGVERRVIKGGSYLCAPNYCLRYRPAARQGEAVDTTTGHIGFRCVVRPG